MFKNALKLTSWSLFIVMVGYVVMALLNLPEPFMWTYRGIVIVILYFFIGKTVQRKQVDTIGFWLVVAFIIWQVISFIRALNYVEGYWLWKYILLNLLTTSFYIVILVATNTDVIYYYLRLYWKYLIPLLLLSFLQRQSPSMLNYVPFAVLMIFVGIVPRQKRPWLLAVTILYFIFENQRNDMVKILLTTMIGLGFGYFYRAIPRWTIKLVHLAFLITPFVLINLAVDGKFNIFKMDEYITGDYTQEVTTAEGLEEENLKGDTRTFIYRNVFATMEKYDAWVMGRSTAFADEGVDDFWGTDAVSGMRGRYGNEVGILDILLWYGLIGVGIYYLIYVRASYLAVYKSNNRYAKGVGLYVAFLWMWAFIWEKPLIETFFMMDLVLLGLCLSARFRSMSDQEIAYWLRNVFYKPTKNQPYESTVAIERAVPGSM